MSGPCARKSSADGPRRRPRAGNRSIHSRVRSTARVQWSDVLTLDAKLDLRLLSAVAVGKFAGLASRQLGRGGGTSLPGVLATRLDADVLGKLARSLPRGAVLV